MADTHVHLNLTPVVSAVVKVLIEPYSAFVTKLHAAGRITDAELAELRQTLLDRGEGLSELVQAELRASGLPSTGSDSDRAAT